MVRHLTVSLSKLIISFTCAFQIVNAQFFSVGGLTSAVQVVSGQAEGQRVNEPVRKNIPPAGSPNLGSALDNAHASLAQSGQLGASGGSLAGLSVGSAVVTPLPVATVGPSGILSGPLASTLKPPPTTTFAGYLVGSPMPFVLPPPDIPYFGSKWNGPWGYPIGHYQAFRGTGQYITHYNYYPLSYFGSLMAPFAYGVSGKK